MKYTVVPRDITWCRYVTGKLDL